MSLSAYEDLVHELARLDADSAASSAQAAKRLSRRHEALNAVRSDLDEQTGSLAELCAGLRHAAPDLTPEPCEGEEADAVLSQARIALREAESARIATVRAAQRPTMLPKAHHVLRELILYGASMAVCFGAQMLYLAVSGGGESTWWVIFLPPVGAALVGYMLVGAANKPRLPLLDRNGKPVKTVVPHNPRLGVTLAVCTMALFAYFAFFA